MDELSQRSSIGVDDLSGWSVVFRDMGDTRRNGARWGLDATRRAGPDAGRIPVAVEPVPPTGSGRGNFDEELR